MKTAKILARFATALCGATLALSPLAARAQDGVQGLELLESVGKYAQPLHRYRVEPLGAEEFAERARLAELLGEQAGIEFAKADLSPLASGAANEISRMGLADPSAVFELDPRGGMLFNSGLDRYRHDGGTEGLPPAEKLLPLAVRQLSLLDLGVVATELGQPLVGGVNMAIPDGQGGSLVFEKFRTLRLQRQLDGLPVEGDTRIILRFGEQGSLAGLIYRWPKLGKVQRLREGDLRSPDALRRDLRRRIALLTRDALRAKLSSLELVLFDDGKGVIEPAYHVVIDRELPDQEGVNLPADFNVSVLAKSEADFGDQRAAVAPADGRDMQGQEPGADD